MNEDIDRTRSHLNYSISPETHGRSTRDCMNYFEELTAGVYHRSGSTITAGQWVVTAPDDLPQEMEKAFFRHTYDFLNHYFYGGDDSRCLLAQVHRDESEIGHCHMHYVMAMPEKDNPKFVSLEEKCLTGLRNAQEHFGIRITREQGQAVYAAIQRYEMSHISSRERYAIRDIGEIFGMKRDDARWIFVRTRRLESERYERRLLAKDEFLTNEMFSNFHPEYQRWMKSHGFDCTVFKGGTGVRLTVEQLKAMTRETGYRIVDEKEFERLHNRVAELEQTLKEKEHTTEWGGSSTGANREWGSTSGWGKGDTW